MQGTEKTTTATPKTTDNKRDDASASRVFNKSKDAAKAETPAIVGTSAKAGTSTLSSNSRDASKTRDANSSRNIGNSTNKSIRDAELLLEIYENLVSIANSL